jgi:hypothetical protein
MGYKLLTKWDAHTSLLGQSNLASPVRFQFSAACFEVVTPQKDRPPHFWGITLLKSLEILGNGDPMSLAFFHPHQNKHVEILMANLVLLNLSSCLSESKRNRQIIFFWMQPLYQALSIECS